LIQQEKEGGFSGRYGLFRRRERGNRSGRALLISSGRFRRLGKERLGGGDSETGVARFVSAQQTNGAERWNGNGRRYMTTRKFDAGKKSGTRRLMKLNKAAFEKVEAQAGEIAQALIKATMNGNATAH